MTLSNAAGVGVRGAAQGWMNAAFEAGIVTVSQRDNFDIIPVNLETRTPWGVIFRNWKGKKVLLCKEWGCDMSDAWSSGEAIKLLQASTHGIRATVAHPGLLKPDAQRAMTLAREALNDPVARAFLLSVLTGHGPVDQPVSFDVLTAP